MNALTRLCHGFKGSPGPPLLVHAVSTKISYIRSFIVISTADLSVYPTFAGMLGGKMIDVSGPCFNPRTFVQCRFGEDTNAVTDGIYVSKTRIRCMVPRLTVRGRVKLSLSTGGSSYSYSAPFTIGNISVTF